MQNLLAVVAVIVCLSGAGCQNRSWGLGFNSDTLSPGLRLGMGPPPQTEPEPVEGEVETDVQ
jgi:hypothetical protein